MTKHFDSYTAVIISGTIQWERVEENKYKRGIKREGAKTQYVHTKDSQKIKIKKKTKTPRITDEGWNSQKRLSDPVEKKMKEGKRRKKRLLYLHLKLSLGLVPL